MGLTDAFDNVADSTSVISTNYLAQIYALRKAIATSLGEEKGKFFEDQFLKEYEANLSLHIETWEKVNKPAIAASLRKLLLAELKTRQQ